MGGGFGAGVEEGWAGNGGFEGAGWVEAWEEGWGEG